MKLLPTILILLTFHICYGQETKSITKKTGGVKEEFTVLATDKKTKHGVYKKYDRRDNLIIEGNYTNDVKTGEWKFYAKGELEHTYDYTLKKITYVKKLEFPSKAIINGTFQEIQLDIPPLYIGSKVGLTDELNKVITYPTEASKMGVEGIVLLSVWIADNDVVSDIKVLQGEVNELNQAAIKGLFKVEKNWIAGIKNGRKVESELLVVVVFKLHDNGDKTITVL